MIRLEHPYSDFPWDRLLRGNLHTHTTRSDGTRDPQDVIDDYAGRGYGFLMISDHDKFADADQVSQWDDRGMVLIPGNEISASGVHMLQIGGTSGVEPVADRQVVIDAALAQGSLIVVNHPNWFENFDHCKQEQMAGWNGYVGLEIYNGVIGRLKGSPYATDHWDMLLCKGRRVWGFANDDSHRAEDGDVELGWMMAAVEEQTPAGVMAALAAGRFYCSTGVTITGIQVDGPTITLETANAERIVALQAGGQRFATADTTSLTVTAPEKAGHVRFECWGRGESFAWTQPFWVMDDED